MSDAVDERLRPIFERLFGSADAQEIFVGATGHPAWDSIAQINLVLAVEQELGISFTPEETGAISSFPAMRSVVNSKLGGGT